MQLPPGFVLDTPKPATGPVYGAPPKVDPYKAEDQQMQRAKFELDQEKSARDAEKDALDIQERQKKLADGDVASAVGEERKAAAFLLRALGANESYEGLGIGPRSLVGQTLSEWTPDLLNELPAGVGNSPERQVADTNQDEFIAASLRQDSGAAIPPEEMERQRRIYFPMPGDGPAVIEAKRQARIRAIAGLKQSSGKLLEETLAAYEKLRAGDTPDATQETTGLYVDPAMIQDNGKPIGMNPDGSFDPGNEPIGPAGGGRPLIDPAMGVSEIPSDGSTVPDFNAEMQVSEKLKAANDELNNLWLSGQIRTVDQLFAEAKRLGLNINTNSRADLQRQIKRGERGSFVPRPDEKRTGVQKAAGAFLDSPLGAYGVGSLNALTMGGIDEIVGLVAGEDQGARVQSVKDYLRENRPVASLAGEVGGAVTGALMAPAAVTNALATKTGATLSGAAYGALDQNDNRILGGLAGGAIGRFAPQATEKAVNALAPIAQRGMNALAPVAGKVRGMFPQNALAQEVNQNANIVRAGMDENIPVRIQDVAPSTRGRYNELKASDGGGELIGKAAMDDAAAIESRLTEIGGAGTVKEGFNAGTAIQDVVKREKSKMSQEASALYRRAEMQAPGFKAPATQVSKTVDDKIAAIKSVTPEGNEGQISLLSKIKGNFEKTGVTTETLQANREIVRQHIKDNDLAFSAKEVELIEIMDAAARDLEESLVASGNSAAAASLKRANEKWAEYSQFKQSVVKELVGTKKSPVEAERAAQRVMAMIKPGGSSAKFAKVFRSMEESEKADLRAAIAANLGKAGNGEFTLAALATNLDHKKVNPATLREVFGPDGYKSLMNLKALARSKQDANVAPIGTNTRREVGGLKGLLLRFMGIGAGAGLGGPVGAIGGAVAIPAFSKMGEKRAARLMLNKDVTKMLRSAPETTNPAAISRWFDTLQKTAPQNSVAAADILALKQALADSFGQSPGKLAASEEEGN
jgi:hypothetical protein